MNLSGDHQGGGHKRDWWRQWRRPAAFWKIDERHEMYRFTNLVETMKVFYVQEPIWKSSFCWRWALIFVFLFFVCILMSSTASWEIKPILLQFITTNENVETWFSVSVFSCFKFVWGKYRNVCIASRWTSLRFTNLWHKNCMHDANQMILHYKRTENDLSFSQNVNAGLKLIENHFGDVMEGPGQGNASLTTLQKPPRVCTAGCHSWWLS